MTTQDLTITYEVDAAPGDVFNAITNMRSWWSEGIEGPSANLHDVFVYRYKDFHYSKQELVERVPDQRLVWQVTESLLYFLEHKEEWTGTRICFDIIPRDDKTQLVFTHQGLTPSSECFEACSGGWGKYVGQSLYQLITTGKGQPDPRESAIASA